MTVILELADGNTEIFKTESYIIGKVKDFHPMICKISIYDNGKKLKSVSRPFKFWYKHFTFKSEKIQERLRKLEEESKGGDK